MNNEQPYKPWLSLIGAAQIVQKQLGDVPDDDYVGDAMLKAATSITDASAQIEKTVTAIMGNQLEPELKRTKAAKDTAFKIAKPVLAKIDSASACARKTIADLTNAALPKKPRDAMEALLHQEVRAALYRLPASERGRVVRQAINEDDDVFLAAAVTGSPLLTGLGKAETALLLHTWQQKHHSDKLERISKLKAGLDQLERVGPMFQAWSLGLFADRNAAVAAAERSAELARVAMADVVSVS